MRAANKLDLDARYRTMLILWLALLISVVMYFVTTQVVSLSPDLRSDDGLFRFLFVAVGLFSAVVSFVVRPPFLKRTVEKPDV